MSRLNCREAKSYIVVCNETDNDSVKSGENLALFLHFIYRLWFIATGGKWKITHILTISPVFNTVLDSGLLIISNKTMVL